MAFALELDASTIHIVDLQSWKRRNSIMLLSGFSLTPFIALVFSGNNKFLIAQGTSTDSLLFYFDVKTGGLASSHKVVGGTNTANPYNALVTYISVNPIDPNSICCTGRGIFRQLTKGDKSFTVKQSAMTNKDSLDFKSHIWTSDGRTIILALSDARISQVDSSSVRVDINLNNPTGASVTHLTATQKGFGCVTAGTRLHFFEGSSEKGFQEINSIQIDDNETIASFSMAQADDRIVVLMSDSRLVSVPLSQSDQSQSGEPPHHIGPVTAVAIAFRKQMLVSCGEDHAVRVWNYERMQCEISKFFTGQPLAVSFHPNGGSIVAGFAEKLRFMAITINDIITYREFSIRGCRECKFSHGGQYFAVVNSNNVQIYSSYTFKNIVNLRSPGQRIKTIAWSTDDNVVVACDANGTMTLFTVRTGKQPAASNQQSFHFTSVVCTDAVGTKCDGVALPDNVLRATEDCVTKDQLDVQGVPCQVTLGPNGKCLFVSTRNGTVLTYCLPGSSATGSDFPSAE
jgi:WD40 repeat protein